MLSALLACRPSSRRVGCWAIGPLALAGVLLTGRPLFAGTICTGPDVVTDAHVDARWAPAIASLKNELRALEDIDACGRVSIFGAGDSVVVEISLADGRGTTRRISRPDELAATVGSLLLLPPGTSHPTEEPHALAPTDTPDNVVIPIAPRETPPAARVIHLEGGLGAGARISGGPFASVGAEIFTHVSIDDFLIGLRFRENFREQLLDPDEQNVHARTASLAAHFGKRFYPSSLALDALFGPALVVEREVLESNHGLNRVGASSEDIRLSTIVRVMKRSTSIRVFGAFDAEISPGRLLGEERVPDPRLPALPTWSAGVSVGLLVGAF